MLDKFKWIVYTNVFSGLIYYCLMLYLSTLRVKTRNMEDVIALLEQGKTVLFCCWHQQFVSAIRKFRVFNKYGPAVMISQSNDGDLISKVAHRVGWKTVRGSSSRGGRNAMSEMIAHLKTNKLAAHILDGPQGPIGKVKPGAIKIANKSGALIVPFYVVADKAWFFRSWDQFMMPKPFSKVELCFGQDIRLTSCESSDEFEQQRQLLEDTMKDGLIIKYPVKR